MENFTNFVSSRGILKSCFSRNNQPISSSNYIDDDLLEFHSENKEIYVCTDALETFANYFLPRINTNFILVSGDSDKTLNDQSFLHGAYKDILDSKYLVNWYAQNLTASIDKLHQIPIGMDYHTMWDRSGIWGLKKQSPLAQERTIINILANSPTLTDRFFTGYCNWHFAIERGDRRECLDKIDKSISFIEQSILPRNTSWQRQAECMFVVSPEGAGIDCHRTWEALILGCIPVVKRSAFTKIFNDLPVVILDDWSEFNSERMINEFNIIKNTKYNFFKLFGAYWNKFIKNTQNNNKYSHMTINDFKKFMCDSSY